MLNHCTTPSVVPFRVADAPSTRYAVRYTRPPHLKALPGDEMINGVFESRYLRVETKRSDDVKVFHVHGITQSLPVYDAHVTSKQIPALQSGMYARLETTLIRKNIYDVVGTSWMTTAQIRQLLDRRSHVCDGVNQQIPYSKTEKVLCSNLWWLVQQGVLKHSRTGAKIRTTRWKRVAECTFEYNKDLYIAYHAAWSYITMLQRWGMRIAKRRCTEPGLANAVATALRHVEKTMERLQKKSPDAYETGCTIMGWIRNAPWNTDQTEWAPPQTGVDVVPVHALMAPCSGDDVDAWYEIWDAGKKIGDVWPACPPTCVQQIRAVEDFLSAHMVYPYDGRVPLGPERVIFTSIEHWSRERAPGTIVWYEGEMRVIAQVDGFKIRLASLGNKRRTFKKWLRAEDVQLGHVERFSTRPPDVMVPRSVRMLRRVKQRLLYTFDGTSTTYIVESRVCLQ